MRGSPKVNPFSFAPPGVNLELTLKLIDFAILTNKLFPPVLVSSSSLLSSSSAMSTRDDYSN
jgi:hypothetical protein